MSFKPDNAKTFASSNAPATPRNFPTPRAGSRPGRVSLIVDLGVQEREPDDKGNPRKPCRQLALFVDLMKDIVDYGGDIGKQPYRLMINKSFKGDIQGINFLATPPKDAEGNIIQGGKWGLHPASPLTKLAKACGRPEVVHEMVADRLLDASVRCIVEVKETEDKNGKKDADGNVIVYKNVNFKGFTELVENDDGDLETVPALTHQPRCVTFKNATLEDVKWLRKDIIAKIKKATDYEGSVIQKVIEEFEAGNGEEDKVVASPAKVDAPKRQEAKPAPSKPIEQDSLDEDLPF